MRWKLPCDRSPVRTFAEKEIIGASIGVALRVKVRKNTLVQVVETEEE